MAFLVGPICPRCGQPQISGILCPACAQSSSSVSTIRSVFRFEGTVREAIHELKYRNLRAIAPTLAGFLSSHLSEQSDLPDAIVPVPLHPTSYKRRGYNQAALLAHELGRHHRLPVLPKCLRRTGAGSSQVRTRNVDERRRNVQNAFEYTGRPLEAARITLIDDVCTTGATLEACATALRGAGAIDVNALTVAREV